MIPAGCDRVPGGTFSFRLFILSKESWDGIGTPKRRGHNAIPLRLWDRFADKVSSDTQWVDDAFRGDEGNGCLNMGLGIFSS